MDMRGYPELTLKVGFGCIFALRTYTDDQNVGGS